ncbi:glutathione S-transferase family protein [Methylococcus sp. EFPC2]|uniref:glutathione S-transferase family protein n=1 Tax=Methylococcus sp. EFPC2 TaxID=2812648 RepID=UPI0019689519|nr:glutathione S-transferase family protein [Methylococcus sp. EFPC2]QSA96308.1 glutathione S-transferase family protein [Methylococcus sp. EFPC2]
MKLYYHPASPFARKPRIAAALLGIELETQVVDILAGAGQAPDYLRLNPHGKVPTLVDGDFSLWESNAIVQYLGEKAADTSLFPRDSRSRADILRWQFWESTTWAPPSGVFIYENVLKPLLGQGEADGEEIRKATEKFVRAAKVLDDHLAQHSWLVGDTLTVADTSVAAVLMYAETARYPLDGYEHIHAWFGKIRQLPAWTATEPSA